MVLNGSPILREMIRDLVSQVEATRKSGVIQLTRGGFSIDTMRGLQFVQMLRLRTLNRYSARLPSLMQAPMIAPFELYLQLRQLLGELAALHPDRDEFDCAPYQHDNQFLCFCELSGKIRRFLGEGPAPTFLKLAFKDVAGTLTANFSPEHFSQPNAYLLGIETKLDATALTRYVIDGDKFKVMAHSLRNKAIRGVELKEERIPPLELPAAGNLHYFRLERANRASGLMWQQIQTEKTAAIVWTGRDLDWSDASFTLYMTVPADGTKP